MSKIHKFFLKLLLGSSDTNISFAELRNLLLRLDFEERVKGSHHIFTREDIEEIINIQPNGAKAKPYQVKQVRNLIQKYKLNINEDE
jgi:predicted RNA binding protein YcfA (HicA-like mRNA interferase family)